MAQQDNAPNLDINKALDLAEKASEALYRARAMVCTAIIINDSRAIDFEKTTFREDGLTYQLEALYEFVKQYESLFDGVVDDILKKKNRGKGEVLLENSV